MICRLLIFMILLSCVPIAQALIPARSQYHMQEVYDYRRQKMAEFEKAQQQHDAELVKRNQRLRQEMATPPWIHAETEPTAAVKLDSTHTESPKASAGQPAHKWMFSLLALLVIGGCMWWVKVKTEDRSSI